MEPNKSQKPSLYHRLKNNKFLAVGIIAILLLSPIGIWFFTHKIIKQHKHISEPLTIMPDQVPGKVITLKKLEEKYIIDYHNAFSNIVRQNLEFPRFITLEYTIRFIQYELRKMAEGKTLLYMIFDNKDDKLIGSVQIKEKNDYDPGQLACWVNEQYWGGGRFQEALELITKTYFQLHPEADHYIAHVRLWNKRSYHALKKFGLKEIAYFYEHDKPARYILRYDRIVG